MRYIGPVRRLSSFSFFGLHERARCRSAMFIGGLERAIGAKLWNSSGFLVGSFGDLVGFGGFDCSVGLV